MPQGMNLIRLLGLFQLLDYQVEEVELLTPIQRVVMRVLVSGKISLADLTSQVKVSEGTVLRWALGKTEPSTDKMCILEEIFISLTEEVLKEDARRNQEIKKLGVITESQISVGSGVNHKQIIGAFVDHLNVILPLAEQLLSDEFSADERKQLRDLTTRGDSHGVFVLSNALNALCGEKAREQIIGGGK
jgi:transcriptional regulator with XRE-family HTH domain